MSGDGELNKRRGSHSFSAWKDHDHINVRAVGSIHDQEDVQVLDEHSRVEDIRVLSALTAEQRVPQVQRHVLLPLLLDGLAEQQHVRGDRHQRTRFGEKIRQVALDASLPDVAFADLDV